MSIVSPVPCIYQIICTSTGKRYIGQTDNAQRRWWEHCSALRRDVHYSRYLQRAWNKYGENAFSFQVIEECQLDQLTQREQYWLDFYKPIAPSGFNLNSRADMPPMLGKSHTDEARAKMSANAKGRKLSVEHRAKISAGLAGKKKSPESIAKRVAATKGRPYTAETLARMSAAQKGKKASPETRAKLSAIHKGKKHSPERIEKAANAQRREYVVTSPDGVEMRIKGLAKFCRENGLYSGCMSKVAIGERKHHKGWKCRRAN